MSRADDIEGQAAAWIARRDRGDGRDAGLSAWLAADPRHRAAYLRLAQAWRRSELLERLRPTSGAIDPDLLATPRPPGRWTRLGRRGGTGQIAPPSAHIPRRAASRAFGWGAMVAGLAAAGFVLWWTLAQPAARIYSTRPGSLYRVVLADGSSIILNADTAVRGPYSTSERRVTLHRGEGPIRGAPCPTQAIEVHANGHIVRDVGTHFDVRLDDGRSFEVLVTQGRVALMPARRIWARRLTSRRSLVTAGELALVDAGGMTVERLAPAQIARRLSWKHRRLRFRGETLARAVADFDKYNSVHFVIVTPSIESVRIGGTFDALDTASFAAALNRSFGISGRTYDGRIYLAGPAPR